MNYVYSDYQVIYVINIFNSKRFKVLRMIVDSYLYLTIRDTFKY